MAIKKEIVLDIDSSGASASLADLRKSFGSLNDDLPLLNSSLNDVNGRLTEMAGSGLNVQKRIRDLANGIDDTSLSVMHINKMLHENQEYFKFLAAQPVGTPLKEVKDKFRELRDEFALWGDDYANLKEYISTVRTLSEIMASGISTATVASILFTRENQILMYGLRDLTDPLVRIQGEEGFGGFSSSVTDFVSDLQNAWTATSVFNETVGADFAESWNNYLKTVWRSGVAIKQEYEDSLTAEEKRTRSLKIFLKEQLDLYEESEESKNRLLAEYETRQAERDENEKVSWDDKLKYLDAYYVAMLERHKQQEEEFTTRLSEVDAKDKEKRAKIQEEIKEARALQKEENEHYKQEYLLHLYELLDEETLIAQERMELETRVQKSLNETLTAGIKAREKEEQEKEKKEKSAFSRFSEGVANTGKTLDKFLTNNKTFVESMGTMFGEYNKAFEDNTVAYKGIATAKAIIDMYKAGQAAFATVPYPGNFVALAGTLATGYKTVKALFDTDVKAGSNGNSSKASMPPTDTAPNISTLEASAPETSMESMYNLPIEQSVTMLASSEDHSLNTSKVYVVETDISETVNKVSVKEAEATY